VRGWGRITDTEDQIADVVHEILGELLKGSLMRGESCRSLGRWRQGIAVIIAMLGLYSIGCTHLQEIYDRDGQFLGYSGPDREYSDDGTALSHHRH
jgi:hypothetical protein